MGLTIRYRRGEKNCLVDNDRQSAWQGQLLESPVILLDEPTSAMDLTTEKKVISNLRDHFSNQTLILVTHRMSLCSLWIELLLSIKVK